jgi:hypothetical protein
LVARLGAVIEYDLMADTAWNGACFELRAVNRLIRTALLVPLDNKSLNQPGLPLKEGRLVLEGVHPEQFIEPCFVGYTWKVTATFH